MPNLPILAPPFPLPAILVGGLTLLSTVIAVVLKARALHAQPAASGRSRRFFSYPWLAVVSLICQLGFAAGTFYFIYGAPAAHTLAYDALAVFMALVNTGMIVLWVWTMARSAQLGRRDWVINMLSGIALGSPVFSIWGPTERRAKAPKADAASAAP